MEIKTNFFPVKLQCEVPEFNDLTTLFIIYPQNMENLRKKFVDRFTTNSTTGAVPSNNLSNNDDTISNHSGSYR